MGAIQERTGRNGEKSYRVQIRIKGARPLSQSFKRKTDAREWMLRTEAAIREGRHFDTHESKKHNLSDLIARYKKDRLVHFKSPRTPERVLDYWDKQLGHLTLDRIDTPKIREQWDKLASEPIESTGKMRTPRTLNSYLESLGAMFAVASKEYGWMRDNPVSRIKQKPLRNQRTRFLDKDELAAFLEAVEEEKNGYLKPVVFIALSTGARQGEILSLKWNDIDLKIGKAILRDTKNGGTRSIHLGRQALNALREHKIKHGIQSEYVFPNRRPRWKNGQAKQQAPWEDITYPFRRARETAGLKDFRFHDLRHTAASYLLASGANLTELGKILGHKTPAMTFRYAHLAQCKSDELIDKMSDRFLSTQCAGG